MTSSSLRFAFFDVDGVILRHRSSWQLIHSRLGTVDIAKVHRALAVEYCALTYRDWAFVDVFLWRGQDRNSIKLREEDFTPGIFELLKYLNSHGVYIIVISGGLELVYEYIRDYVDLFVSNSLIYVDNKIFSVNVHVSTKEDIVQFLERFLKIDWSKSLAVGDSVIDVPMLRRARYSIAYNPADAEVTKYARFVVYGSDMYPVLQIVKTLLM